MTYYLDLHDGSRREGCVPFTAAGTHEAILSAKWLLNVAPTYTYAQIRAADGHVVATFSGQEPTEQEPVQAKTWKQLTLDL